MGKKVFYLIIPAAMLFAVGTIWFAQAMQQKRAATLKTPGTERLLMLPPMSDRSQVISLGSAIDPQSGEQVEGFAIIHPKQKAVKPDNPGGGNKKPPKDDEPVSDCFNPLARGAVWRAVEPWLFNTDNVAGLDSDYLLQNLVDDIAKWEDATDGVMDGVEGFDILGDGQLSVNELLADADAPDGLNEVYFGDIETPGAIGVTIVWGVFGGAPPKRQLMEWDMVFDQADFGWSMNGDPGKMDFENIATHELGHSIGLGHPVSTCTEETMYAYSDYGEVKKRDLNDGDIAGTADLY